MGPVGVEGVAERRPKQAGSPPHLEPMGASRAWGTTAETIQHRDIPPALREQSQRHTGT